MNLYLQIYLYICDKLSLHFTVFLSGTIALSFNFTTMFKNICLNDMLFVVKKKNKNVLVIRKI